MLLLSALFLSVVLVKGRFTWQRWALLLPFVLPTSSLAIAWRGMWGDLLNSSAALPLTLLLYLLRCRTDLDVFLEEVRVILLVNAE